MRTRALSIGTEHGVTHITEEKQNANISNENPDNRAIRTINPSNNESNSKTPRIAPQTLRRPRIRGTSHSSRIFLPNMLCARIFRRYSPQRGKTSLPPLQRHRTAQGNSDRTMGE
nr:MAG TPA: hypothetical protein [Caudoviricetes sp.]